MSRRISIAVLLTLVAGTSSLLAVEPPAKKDGENAVPGTQPQRSTWDPNDSQKTRLMISGVEREKLGICTKNWNGVVHPDVSTTIERQETTIAGLKKRLSAGRDREAFDAMNRFRFEGMVYVQVHLKLDSNTQSEAKGKLESVQRTQQDVLRSMTAADFHVQYLFESQPAILGYADRSAIEILSKSPLVSGVCLDPLPIPDYPPHPTKEDVAQSAGKDHDAGSEAGKSPSSSGRFEAEVYKAIKSHDHVFVIVLPRDPRQSRGMGPDNIGKARAIEDNILDSLAANEFWTVNRSQTTSPLYPRLTGFINASGLAKLEKTSDVSSVSLDKTVSIPRDVRGH